jgi:hypothetical protein
MFKLKSFFPRKGSVLVFSLVILSFLLVAALSVAVVSVTERRGSLATDRSNRSFQVADSGAEIVLQKIYKGNATDISALAIAAGGVCSGGVISGSISSGDYKISLYDDSGVQLTNCADTTWRSQVAQLKSQGISGNTVRAVEVAVAAPPTPGITGGCMVSSSKVRNKWGEGCKDNNNDATSCLVANVSDLYACGPVSDGSNILFPIIQYSFCLCVNK